MDKRFSKLTAREIRDSLELKSVELIPTIDLGIVKDSDLNSAIKKIIKVGETWNYTLYPLIIDFKVEIDGVRFESTSNPRIPKDYCDCFYSLLFRVYNGLKSIYNKCKSFSLLEPLDYIEYVYNKVLDYSIDIVDEVDNRWIVIEESSTHTGLSIYDHKPIGLYRKLNPSALKIFDPLGLDQVKWNMTQWFKFYKDKYPLVEFDFTPRLDDRLLSSTRFCKPLSMPDATIPDMIYTVIDKVDGCYKLQITELLESTDPTKGIRLGDTVLLDESELTEMILIKNN